MCTRYKRLCLEEAIWIYLPNFKSNQNWLLRIQKPSPETTLMFLWFLRWRKRSAPRLQLRRVSKTEDRGIQKLTLHHSHLSKWESSKRSEFLNISFTSASCWLRYNQWEVLLFSLQRFFSQRNHTIFVWQSTARETSHIFVACFPVVKIILIYVKIQQLTWMSRSLKNINLKIFRVACRYNLRKICRQNRRECWHRYIKLRAGVG